VPKSRTYSFLHQRISCCSNESGRPAPEIGRIGPVFGRLSLRAVTTQRSVGMALLDSSAHRFNGQVLRRPLAILFAVAMAASTAFAAVGSRPCLCGHLGVPAEFWFVRVKILAKPAGIRMARFSLCIEHENWILADF
jgi:hypothetical protein